MGSSSVRGGGGGGGSGCGGGSGAEVAEIADVSADIGGYRVAGRGATDVATGIGGGAAGGSVGGTGCGSQELLCDRAVDCHSPFCMVGTAPAISGGGGGIDGGGGGVASVQWSSTTDMRIDATLREFTELATASMI